MFKQLFIPVAAFAITVTGASAFTGTDMLSKLSINLSDSEEAALTEVQEIREAAHTEVKAVLEEAGITEERMKEIRESVRAAHKEHREAVKAAVEANDYEAFKLATADTPLATEVDTEAEFAKMVEAHELMEAGDREGAKAIMDELGLKGPHMGNMGRGHDEGDAEPMN